VSVLRIRLWPDAVLREKSKSVTFPLKENLQTLVDDMIETVQSVNGAGLAAVQVGQLWRIAVVNLGEDAPKEGSDPHVLINPEILHSEGETAMMEGCLSIPGESEVVVRPQFLSLRAFDRQGKSFELEGTEFLAKALCHEVDHMDGILYMDHLSPLKRSRLVRRLKKLIRDGSWDDYYQDSESSCQ